MCEICSKLIIKTLNVKEEAVLQGWSVKTPFWKKYKIHRKIPVLDSLFNKTAGRQKFCFKKKIPTAFFIERFSEILQSSLFVERLWKAVSDVKSRGSCLLWWCQSAKYVKLGVVAVKLRGNWHLFLTSVFWHYKTRYLSTRL